MLFPNYIEYIGVISRVSSEGYLHLWWIEKDDEPRRSFCYGVEEAWTLLPTPDSQDEVEVLVYSEGRVIFGIDKYGRRVHPNSWDCHVISALAIVNQN